MKSTLPEIVRRLPGSPGVYKFFNEEGGLIYVGKAKNIRKRVTSYFNKISGLHPKTRRLVSEIRNIEYVLSESEFDALLLEKDRKSTRLNSSHVKISYAVFCLKKKNK